MRQSPRTHITLTRRESNAQLIDSRLVQFTLASGRVDSVTVSASRHGVMEPSTAVNGVKTELTVKVVSFM